MRTAFVLAGGGSLGAIQVGMLRALAEAGVTPQWILGSSVGAINAAYYAGAPGLEGVERLEALWRSIGRRNVFPFRPMRSLLGLASWSDGFLSPDSLGRLIREHLGYERLEDAAIPIGVIATDLDAGTAIPIWDGDAEPALLASAAIPGVFPPVELGGRRLIDGGVAANTPLAEAVATGAERIIVLPTGYSCNAPMQTARPGPIGVALQALNHMIAGQLVRDVEAMAPGRCLAVAPPPCPMPVSAYDFGRTPQLIEEGARATREWIERGGIDRCEVPTSLRIHGLAAASA